MLIPTSQAAVKPLACVAPSDGRKVRDAGKAQKKQIKL